MHDTNAHDLSLLHALDDGQEQAFWTLWLRHSRRLFAVCLREMNGNRLDAEDALHEAMLRAYARLPRFAARITSPASWLARMTANVCRDTYRLRARRSQTAEQFAVLQPDCVALPEVTQPDQPTEEYDPSTLVSLLPDRLRDVFVLRLVEGVPYRDIAARLGLTCVTVRKRVQQSRTRLRAWRSSGSMAAAAAASPRVPRAACSATVRRSPAAPGWRAAAERRPPCPRERRSCRTQHR